MTVRRKVTQEIKWKEFQVRSAILKRLNARFFKSNFLLIRNVNVDLDSLIAKVLSKKTDHSPSVPLTYKRGASPYLDTSGTDQPKEDTLNADTFRGCKISLNCQVGFECD